MLVSLLVVVLLVVDLFDLVDSAKLSSMYGVCIWLLGVTLRSWLVFIGLF